ncbi:phage tail terminator family protein [Tindallia californiensis]|uniref:Uncharacterized protein n=1 Tax=Tindallia californiensis TaxID=159292 RepID=A0A1H3R0U3_9FIRM|nr:hypothetical protein [Tindallia californiensis]SDZ19297.1 hypothetical protein SAMN05192546_11175 [Tindallia californiensis]
MIPVKSIVRSINTKIIEEFPEIPIQSRDVKEGFSRPSFFLRLANIEKETFLRVTLRQMTCRVLYFASNRYESDLENLEILDRLEKVFALNFSVETEDLAKIVTISDTRSQFVDDVLEFEFDFSFYQDNDSDDEELPLMEELEMS